MSSTISWGGQDAAGILLEFSVQTREDIEKLPAEGVV